MNKGITKAIPKRVDILGRKYDVIFPYIFETGTTYAGMHDNCEMTIKLTNNINNTDIPIPFIHVVLMHEVMHGIVSILATNDTPEIPESVIDGFSLGLYQVIVDNNLYKGEIPKYLKIGGLTYEVTYPYGFVDENDVSVAINNPCGKILLADVGVMDYKLRRLTFGICSAVYYVYCGGRDFSDLKINLEEGIYSTIRDNNLDKLFIKYSYKGMKNASKKTR